MPTREEIREGMVAYIKMCGNKPNIYPPRMCAEDLVEYLDSEGVVIKVETWLPARSGMTCTIEPLVEK